jgi:tetratricopeptide (TPR) repeat protein
MVAHVQEGLVSMSWFTRQKGYDRARLLDEARRAVRRRDHRKAIALYERVREVEPANGDILRRLAGQRARAGQREEAWRDTCAAAEHLVKRGFVEQAIGVYRDFATCIPRETGVWTALSDLELERGRRPDAVGVLLEGRRFFRSRATRPDALSLLHRARRIDPSHFEANFNLACTLARDGGRAHALRILHELERTANGRNLRRLRARQFRLSPGPGSAWRWLRAWIRGT